MIKLKENLVMKTFLYLSFISFVLFSCGTSEDSNSCDEFDCGIHVDIKKEFFMHTLFQSTVTSENKARYLWYTENGYACTHDMMSITFDLNLDASKFITEVDVRMWVLTEGTLTEIDLEQYASANSSSYSFFEGWSFGGLVAGCFSTVQLRMQIDFDNFGTTALNDNYMESLLLDDSEMIIGFSQGED